MASGDSGQFWLRTCSLAHMQSAAIGTPERGVFPACAGMNRRGSRSSNDSKGTGWGFLVMVVALAGLVGGLIHRWNPKKPAG